MIWELCNEQAADAISCKAPKKKKKIYSKLILARNLESTSTNFKVASWQIKAKNVDPDPELAWLHQAINPVSREENQVKADSKTRETRLGSMAERGEDIRDDWRALNPVRPREYQAYKELLRRREEAENEIQFIGEVKVQKEPPNQYRSVGIQTVEPQIFDSSRNGPFSATQTISNPDEFWQAVDKSHYVRAEVEIQSWIDNDRSLSWLKPCVALLVGKGQNSPCLWFVPMKKQEVLSICSNGAVDKAAVNVSELKLPLESSGFTGDLKKWSNEINADKGAQMEWVNTRFLLHPYQGKMYYHGALVEPLKDCPGEAEAAPASITMVTNLMCKSCTWQNWSPESTPSPLARSLVYDANTNKFLPSSSGSSFGFSPDGCSMWVSTSSPSQVARCLDFDKNDNETPRRKTPLRKCKLMQEIKNRQKHA